MLNIKDLNARILHLSMIDTTRNSMIALPVVVLFEVYMIISWIINVEDKTFIGNIGYLIGYIFMLVFCALILCFMHNSRKDVARNASKINVMQHVLAFVFILWALSFTFIGSEIQGHFDYLIIITFLTVIPLFCYLNVIYWICLQVLSAGCMFYMASHHDRFFSFLINFGVFIIISMVAGWSMHQIRRIGYMRQIELEEERNMAYDLAHRDSLTGLPNRHSCNEDFEKLKNDVNPQDIIIIMCDVNGLKEVNDQLGHEAGDELLIGAATSLQRAFQSMGTIYRVGGDEFTGILHGSEQQLQDSILKLEWITSNWKGQTVKKLSVAIGHSSVRSNPSASLRTLMTQADNAMYEAKRKYYQSVRTSSTGQ